MTNSNYDKWSSGTGWSSEQNNLLDQMHYGLEHRKRAKLLPHGVAAAVTEMADGTIMGRSEAYMRERGRTGISAEASSRLSQTRQEYLKEQAERAPNNPRPNLGLAAQVSPRIKTASVAASTQGRLHNSSNTTNMGPDFYSPFLLTQNLMLPRDRQTMNAWNRAFYDHNPYVRNAINLHSTYPVSKLTIKCEDKKVEKFFLDMAERLDLQTVVQNCASELWQLGEKVGGDSLITMADGSLKPIRDVQVGDLVMTHTGQAKKVLERFIKPTNTLVEEALKIYKISTTNLWNPLIITSNHPMLSTNKGYFVCNKKSCRAKGMRIWPGNTTCSNCRTTGYQNDALPDFVPAGELGLGDIVYAPYSKDENSGAGFTPDLCYLIGQWIAEGCYCRGSRKSSGLLNGIKFCSYDRAYIFEVLEPLIRKVFHEEPKTYISTRYGFSGREDYSKPKEKFDTWLQGKWKNGPEIAAFFLEHCGQYSKTKKMSQTLMELPPELQKWILAGFIDGDGSVDKTNGHALLCTASKDLANQILLMLRRMGAHPSMAKEKTGFKVQIVANEAHELFLGKLKSFKNERLQIRQKCSPHSGRQENWQLLTVKKIEDITAEFGDPFMYDLEVEDDHSYVANGIAIHNCFNYASFDENTGSWDHIYQHNPDYIRVHASPLQTGQPIISLRPDPELIKIITSNEPEHIRMREQIDPAIIEHIQRNEAIPLDNFNISHLKMLNRPYDVRGTSIICSVWRQLMLLDKIYESKLVQFDAMINPITLVKLGENGVDGHYPRQDEIDAFRSVLEAGQFDKDYKIVTHQGVTIERVGWNSGVLDF